MGVFLNVPDIILHVPGKFISWKAVQEVDKWQVVPDVMPELMKSWIGIVHIFLIEKEEHRSQRNGQAVPKLLWSIVGVRSLHLGVLQSGKHS